jgi:3-methyladenine DNA glycosylase AlkD
MAAWSAKNKDQRMSYTKAVKTLAASADAAKAAFSKTFFKTGKGQYGEGDVFLGISVPDLRRLAKEYGGLPLADIEKLLQSKHNETRLLALLVLDLQYKAGNEVAQNKIYALYLKNRARVNNWNLVDASAPYIFGRHLLTRDRAVLYRLAASDKMWDRRIAIVGTLAFIRAGDLDDTFQLCEILMQDKEDLMHKACGWMLREAGKKDVAALEKFLKKHAAHMPRTMLRYAIERFAVEKRAVYMGYGKK